MIKYLFDVDGTLTPSRSTIDPKFAAWFWGFIQTRDVYLVTGSDYSKTLEQLGSDICEEVTAVYSCSGNEVWQQGNVISTKEWTPPDSLVDLMNGWLQASQFPLRTGNHIEHRPGMVNFSIVGRGASKSQREEYVVYDKRMRERETIAGIINRIYDDITATIGGETGIDIAPTGSDKSQVLTNFQFYDKINFYGDAMYQGGNDWSLALALENGKYSFGKAFPVKGWKDTWETLKRQEEKYGNI